jgi:hypothetical protein
LRDNLILGTCYQYGLSCPDAIDATGIAEHYDAVELPL